MCSLRVQNHPILSINSKTEEINFTFNHEKYKGIKGDTIASALLAHNIRILRHHEKTGEGRGLFCNIGHCFECRVTVNGSNNQRACLTLLKEGMEIVSGKQLPTPFKKDSPL
jgi:sarcosine oxidase, subunit alpha